MGLRTAVFDDVSEIVSDQSNLVTTLNNTEQDSRYAGSTHNGAGELSRNRSNGISPPILIAWARTHLQPIDRDRLSTIESERNRIYDVSRRAKVASDLQTGHVQRPKILNAVPDRRIRPAADDSSREALLRPVARDHGSNSQYYR